jgi:hypothetical protein
MRSYYAIELGMYYNRRTEELQLEFLALKSDHMVGAEYCLIARPRPIKLTVCHNLTGRSTENASEPENTVRYLADMTMLGQSGILCCEGRFRNRDLKTRKQQRHGGGEIAKMQ